MRMNNIRFFSPEYFNQLKQTFDVLHGCYLPRHRHNDMPALLLHYNFSQFLAISAYHQYIKPVG